MVGRKESALVAMRAPAVSTRVAPGMIRPTKARDSAKEVKKITRPEMFGWLVIQVVRMITRSCMNQLVLSRQVLCPALLTLIEIFQ